MVIWFHSFQVIATVEPNEKCNKYVNNGCSCKYT